MYQRKKTGDIFITKKWNANNSYELTFDKIRNAILKLIKDGESNNREGIVKSKIS